MTRPGPIPLSVWLAAARPKTIAATIAPVLVGTAMAYESDGFHAPAALCALLGAVLIQVGTNYANDYFDYVKGADQADRLGPVRATQAGLVPPAAMRLATLGIFLVACVPGLYLVVRGGWPILAIGLASMASGILYTAGPAPLGYIGLADLFVLVFFGPVAVGGTYYVQTLHMDPAAGVAGIGAGLFSVAILTVNNLRDIAQDRRAKKRTLAVRFGRNFARFEYLFSVITASAGIPALLFFMTGKRGVWVALATVAAAVPTLYTVWNRSEGSALNTALAQTGGLLLVWSALFSIGWNV